VRGLFALMLMAIPAMADVLPALHDVQGVATNDVLNLRTSPDAGSAIVGMLAPAARDVEVVEVTADGTWGRVHAGEASGWAAMRFLARQPGPDWTALQTNLSCHGTEPFWNTTLAPARGAAIIAFPDSGTEPLTIPWSAVMASGPATAGFRLSGEPGDGFATVTAARCSDGMSDAVAGLSVALFLATAKGNVALSGCCTLVP
jgi:uncharacterized membrane protein